MELFFVVSFFFSNFLVKTDIVTKLMHFGLMKSPHNGLITFVLL